MYRLFLSICTALLWPLAVAAQEAPEKPLPLNGRIASDGSSVTLDWFDAARPQVGSIRIKRRLLGETGGASWVTIAADLGVAMQFTDTDTRPGIAYEYQVSRLARDVVDVGYWVTGVDLPAQETRGIAYVVIDQSVLDPLTTHLDRFIKDLTGDGWKVVHRTVPRGNAKAPVENLQHAANLRAWLQQQYQQEQSAQKHAIILIGHVPIVMSGSARPDGHGLAPHATDLFYGDLDGIWQVGSEGKLLNTALPSDTIEMQIGRIDFSNLGEGADEIALLMGYLNKNHHWRTGLLGDLREAYAQGGWLQTETYGLRNVVGPDMITVGGHHDVGELKPWLWGVDFGDPNGQNYPNYANKALFAINFGSYKQNFDQAHNPMTALLAQPFYPVAVGWGARPAWWLHLMALGGTIGDVHMRTVNNGRAAQAYRESMDYWPTGQYIWKNPIWVNLLGDPTLRAFMVPAPVSLRARSQGDSVTLSWEASEDPDVLGYRIYRITKSDKIAHLNNGDLVADLQFTDFDALSGSLYMVRAYSLKSVPAGSFYTLSQAGFAVPDEVTTKADPIVVTTLQDQPVSLPDSFNMPQDGVIRSVIAPPATGTLRLRGTTWRYTPPVGFHGEVRLPYAQSDAWHTAVGIMTIHVNAPDL